MARFMSFLRQAERFIAGSGHNSLYGHPHKKRKKKGRHHGPGSHESPLYGTGYSRGLGRPTSQGYGSVVGGPRRKH